MARDFFYLHPMTDIVIPLGWGSVWNNNELRYSLRSLEKHLTGVGNLYIVTDLSGMPNWIRKNVIHVACPDLTNIAAVNTAKKILRACELKTLSDNFLLSNDDFFLLDEFNAATFPNFYRGTLSEYYPNPKNTPYPKTKANTAILLKQLGYPNLHYGVHCPILINKRSFNSIIGSLKLNTETGYLTRSIYGNALRLPAEAIKDPKISGKLDPDELKKFTEGKRFFAIGDDAVNRPLMDFLHELYPDKSRWEI